MVITKTTMAKEARIHQQNWDGKTEISSPFPSITNANNAVGHIIAADGAIVLHKDVNEHDGNIINTLTKIGNSKLWGETDYEVLPVSNIPL